MLVYVASNTTNVTRPDLVLGGIALREAEEPVVRAHAGERQAGDGLVEATVGTGLIKLLVAVARDQELANAASLPRCFEGLYIRLRVLLESGLRPAGDWPSLFFSVPGSQFAEAQRGVDAAARKYGEAKMTFVAPDTDGSAGGRIASSLAGIVAASYSGRPVSRLIARLLWNGDRPSGWLHYTLNRDCPCIACRAARSATTPETHVSLHGPTSSETLIERANLPLKVTMSLKARGIRTLTQVERMADAELLHVRNVGRSHVEMLRAAVARYRDLHPY